MLRTVRSLIAVAGLSLAAEYGPPRTISHVAIADLNESSGVVSSRSHPGLFWSHNDSGGGPWLYGFLRDGKAAGKWYIRNARNLDWEDIAAGPAPRGGTFLYIGDIGDNNRERRSI